MNNTEHLQSSKHVLGPGSVNIFAKIYSKLEYSKKMSPKVQEFIYISWTGSFVRDNRRQVLKETLSLSLFQVPPKS